MTWKKALEFYCFWKNIFLHHNSYYDPYQLTDRGAPLTSMLVLDVLALLRYSDYIYWRMKRKRLAHLSSMFASKRSANKICPLRGVIFRSGVATLRRTYWSVQVFICVIAIESSLFQMNCCNCLEDNLYDIVHARYLLSLSALCKL